MTLRHMDFKKHCRLVFELYVEAHDDPNITTKCPQGLMNELHSDPPEICKGKISFFPDLRKSSEGKKDHSRGWDRQDHKYCRWLGGGIKKRTVLGNK